MEDMEAKEEGGYSLSEKDISTVKSALAMIEPLAKQEGCSVAELIEKVQGGDMDEESTGNPGKVALIVARMKNKKPEGGAGSEYEG